MYVTILGTQYRIVRMRYDESESGLADSSCILDSGWAKNEEMVDWIASRGPLIYEAWREAGAL